VTLHLGLDLGGTNIKSAVLELVVDEYEVVAEGSLQTGAEGGPDTVTANLIKAARQLGDKTGPFSTVGLGVPGHFEPDTGRIIIFPNLPGGWPGYPLRDKIQEALSTPTWMINDARAFTLGEGLMGAGRGRGTVVCMTLGTGVGGGIMIDGQLHRGESGVAGELGHQIVMPDGPVCGCGNRGCVEAVTRAGVLAALAGKETAAEVYEAARDGDERSVAAVQQVADYLGIGLANVVTMIGPGRIVIGGGIAEAGAGVFGPIEDAVRSRVTLVPDEAYEIVPAELGRSAGAIGAALAGVIRP